MNPATTDTTADAPNEVVLISHSPIFYWWPVWLVGFLLAALSFTGDRVLAIVPVGTTVERQKSIEGLEGPRDVLVVPAGKAYTAADGTATPTGTLSDTRLRISSGNGPGVVFAVVLCIVIVITNIHLRGLYSVIAILALILTTVTFAVLGLWDRILNVVGLVEIHINAFGYLSISLFIFAIWAVTFLVYDRRNRFVFRRGQLRVQYAIGAGERSFDTFGMAVEKHPDDIFRHWFLGFGSGDLTVRASGSNAETFEVPNVLNVNAKLKQVQSMLKERKVIGQ
jgi:hypothetical protein